MNCPACNVELRIADREGLEIDYCPRCRGVWLDRGELDKIVERSAHASSLRTAETYHQDEYRRPYSGKKKKSFLGDLFDIG
jgi:Zn-finger nucleic acid-binding protein